MPTVDVYSLEALAVLRRHLWQAIMASTQPITQDVDPFADRRAYPRVEVALPAFLQVNGERLAVHLLDVSSGGAKLNCPTSLAVAAVVMLDCGTLGHAAVVRWQNGDIMGVKFERELDGKVVSALIDRSHALAARMKTKE